MRVVRRLAILTIAVSSLHVGGANSQVDSTKPDSLRSDPCKCWPGHCNDVSLIAVIANPERFENTCVMVTGYLRLDFEGRAIYVSHEDYRRVVSKNGLWVDWDPDPTIDTSALADHYVTLLGRFSAASLGHMSGWSGSLKVDRALIMPWNRKALGIDPVEWPP